jgi:hypothetical protein
MANAPTHYRVTVNRPFEYARARFRPGATYTLTASVYEGLVETHPEAIATAAPLNKG